MTLLDANVLIHAADESSARHAEARAFVEQCFDGTETIGLAWSVLPAFLRLTTKARVMADPLPVGVALTVIDGWLGRRNAVVLQPGDRHAALLGPLGTGGNLTADAHLAALAIEHGATLCSYDSDLGRFAGVRWSLPGDLLER